MTDVDNKQTEVNNKFIKSFMRHYVKKCLILLYETKVQIYEYIDR